MIEQINLFEDGFDEVPKVGQVLTKDKKSSGDMWTDLSTPIKCYRSTLESIEYLSLEELFDGFDSVKIFTFSYATPFLDKILGHFHEAKIIIGADFTARRGDLNNIIVSILTNEELAPNSIKNNPKLFEALKDGRAEIRVPNFELVHKKIYLLKSSTDGRVRSIVSSANATNRAWSQSHQSEHVEFYDDYEMYNALNEEFETSWEDSREILLGEVATASSDKNNFKKALKNKIKHVKEVVVLTPPQNKAEMETTKFSLAVDKNQEEFEDILGKSKFTKTKGSLTLIESDVIKKAVDKYTKKQCKIETTLLKTTYPQISISYEELNAKLNNELIPFDFSKEELKKSVANFLNAMAFYDSGAFQGDILNRQKTFFKLMNIMFTSPFNAKVRYESYLADVGVEHLPFYVSITSPADGGKNFAIELFLRMMTGKEVLGFKAFNKEEFLATVMREDDVVPIFLDEVDNKKYSNYKEIIKLLYSPEFKALDKQPLIVMASNNELTATSEIRKRSVFFHVDGGKSENWNTGELQAVGENFKKNATPFFFQEYLKRMIPIAKSVIEDIENGVYKLPEGKIGVDYQRSDIVLPTLIDKSSQVIIDIIKECGFNVPNYMTVLDWNEEVDGRGSSVVMEVVKEIENLYESSPKSFAISGDKIEIILKSQPKRWESILPYEAKFVSVYLSNKNIHVATLNKKWFSKYSNIFKKQNGQGFLQRIFRKSKT